MDKATTQQNSTQRNPKSRLSWRHMTKRQRKNRKRINRLTEYWPMLFNTDEMKPVKAGVIDDMVQDAQARGLEIGQGVLRGSLISYIHTTRYLRALIAGGPRYDLNGKPCGEVTPDEKTAARELLKKRLEKLRKKPDGQQEGKPHDNRQHSAETGG